MTIVDELIRRYSLSSGQQGIDRLFRNGLWDQVIEEINGRRIRVGTRWLIDFASCNYLGFDLDPEIQAAVARQVARWGTHPSWSRMLGSPRPYVEIEDRMAELMGVPAILVLPTISQIHLSVIPVLAAGGTILLDSRAHRTIYEGCVHARAEGATITRFRTGDADHLAELLRAAPAGPRLVCMDGVNSMTGNAPDIGAFARVCREHDALLYVDDAHGFGILGERRPDETSPYGARGNGIVRHQGESYENVVLVGGFSKAYSAMLAWITCTPQIRSLLKVAATPYLYSGPVPTASLAAVLAGFDVNAARGDAIRAELFRKSGRVLAHLRALGVATPNGSGYPLIQVPLAAADPSGASRAGGPGKAAELSGASRAGRPGKAAEDLDRLGRALLERGIYVTLAPYPGVPRSEVGFRVQVTAANTDEEIDALLDALSWLSGQVALRPAGG